MICLCNPRCRNVETGGFHKPHLMTANAKHALPHEETLAFGKPSCACMAAQNSGCDLMSGEELGALVCR